MHWGTAVHQSYLLLKMWQDLLYQGLFETSRVPMRGKTKYTCSFLRIIIFEYFLVELSHSDETQSETIGHP